MAASAQGVFTIYKRGAPHTPKNVLNKVIWPICCDGERVTLPERAKQMEADLQNDYAQQGELVFTGYKREEPQMS